MNDARLCGNSDAFVSYLYGELDEGERRVFDAHLTQCDACARELDDLRSVRTDLAAWSPPDTVLGFEVVREAIVPSPAPSRWTWLQMPAWAQLAAASLVIAVATAVSGLEVQYGRDGVVVRTGWSKPPAQVVGRTTGPAAGSGAPWRTDLAALERQLRQEFRQTANASQAKAAGPVSAVAYASGGRAMSDDEFLSRVRSLVEASEQRQQRELALRLAEVAREMETQRRTDLAHVADGLGVIEGRTGAAVAQQREVLNYLMRVSQRQEPPR